MRTKLSHKVRPDLQAAPWVYDEIVEMEEEIERLDKAIVTLLADNDSLRTTIDQLRIELLREQMRLAACGVVAMANTPDTAAKARNILPEYHSDSCDEVARVVDENMKLRAAIDRVRALHENDGYGSCGHCLMNGEIEDGLREAHPCPTLRALDGEDA
jgi:DUF917 family protein